MEAWMHFDGDAAQTCSSSPAPIPFPLGVPTWGGSQEMSDARAAPSVPAPPA